MNSFIQSISDYLSGDALIDSTLEILTGWARNENLSEDDLESFSSTLWTAIIHCAQRLPDKQDQLVDLLAAIRQLPSPTKGGQPLKCWDAVYWADLPLLGMEVREAWNWLDPPANDASQEDKRRQWINLNAFIARSTGRQVIPFDLYAIWAMRRALEGEDENSSDDHVQVEAAAQWIFHAGQRLYDSEQVWEHGPLIGDPASGGPLWSGKRGFCKERWALWKSRFQQIVQDSSMPQRTREVAEEAARRMVAIEHAY